TKEEDDDEDDDENEEVNGLHTLPAASASKTLGTVSSDCATMSESTAMLASSSAATSPPTRMNSFLRPVPYSLVYRSLNYVFTESWQRPHAQLGNVIAAQLAQQVLFRARYSPVMQELRDRAYFRLYHDSQNVLGTHARIP